jgi:hypothetical protein
MVQPRLFDMFHKFTREVNFILLCTTGIFSSMGVVSDNDRKKQTWHPSVKLNDGSSPVRIRDVEKYRKDELSDILNR